MFGVCRALYAAFVGKMRSEIPSHFFQLGARRLSALLQSARGGFVGFAAPRLRFFLDFFDGGCGFVLQVVARFGDLFVPLLGAGSAFGGDGL